MPCFFRAPLLLLAVFTLGLLQSLYVYFVPSVFNQVAVPEILGTLKANTARSQWLYGATGTSSSVATKSLATIDKLLTSSGIRDDW